MAPHTLLLLFVPALSVMVRQKEKISNSSNIGTGSNTSISSGASSSNATQGQTEQPPSFTSFYDGHADGHGMWKWNNALLTYDHIFAGRLAALAKATGPYFKIAEVGVQSGGSLDMWKAVLGPTCYTYGIDINPQAKKFADERTYIQIGDQGDKNMWAHFWTSITSSVDVFIDDGSHEPDHITMALEEAFPHLNPGGFVAIEDIHGAHYIQSFYWSAAFSIHLWDANGLVESVSLSPFLFVVKKTSSPSAKPPLPYAHVTVNSFPELWAALAQNAGKTIALKQHWASFFAQTSLYTIFEQFVGLNDYQMSDTPSGCHKTPAPVCTVSIANSNAQAYISSVDIYRDGLFVHVPPSPPVIQAVRKGKEWLHY